MAKLIEEIRPKPKPYAYTIPTMKYEESVHTSNEQNRLMLSRITHCISTLQLAISVGT